MVGFSRVSIHQGELDALLRGPQSPIVRTVERYTRRGETAAKRRAPVDDGTLRASIQSEVTIGLRIVGRIWTPLKYGLYQHQGTGVYAGNGPIRPKNGEFLVFRPKQGGPKRRGRKGGKGRLVFAKEVKGVPPNPFLREALEEVVPWPVRSTL